MAVEDRAREEIARQDERNRKLAQYLKAQTTRLMAELTSAARYVASILPDDLEGRVPVSARYLPSEELGGGTYDFRWLDDDHLMVYLVDVSGHGVGPALLAVSIQNLLRSGTMDSQTQLRPDTVLTELNRLFQMDRHGGNYFTMWFGVYEASSRTLRYASAGHPPALVMAGGPGLSSCPRTRCRSAFSTTRSSGRAPMSCPQPRRSCSTATGRWRWGCQRASSGHWRSSARLRAACEAHERLSARRNHDAAHLV